MSTELLQAWVNDEVVLSRPVLSFEDDLANGYLLAELLHRHSLVSKLDVFADKQAPNAKIENFRQLHPVLVDLGVKFDSRLANAMIAKKSGVALNLVYQLKLAIDSAKAAGAIPGFTAASGGSLGAAPQLGTSRVRTTRRVSSEAMQASHFESMMKKAAQDPKELAEALVVSQYNSFMLASTRRMEDVASQEANQNAAVSQQRRQLELSKQRESKRLMDEWEAEGRRKHAENLATHREREKGALRFELTRRDNKLRTGALADARAAADQAGGIDEFEATLKRLSSDADAEAEITPSDLGRMSLHSDAHLASLASSLPRAEAMQGDADAFMERLRSRKLEEAQSRKEREVRRRKVMLEQAESQAALEERRRDELLLTKLGRQCAEERSIAERLWQTQQEKAVMRENRLLREQQYDERREADARERIARERELGAAARVEFAAQLAFAAKRAEEAVAAEAEAAKAARHAMCRKLALQLADIAEAATEMRATTQQLLPPKVMREWLTLFVNGVGLRDDRLTSAGPPDELPPADGAVEAEAAAAAESGASDALLSSAELDDYLLGKAEWRPEALSAIALPEGAGAAAEASAVLPASEEQGCAITGRMVLQLLEATAPPPPPPPKLLSSAVMKLAVLGKPFSSKSEHALRLADTFGLKVIMPHALVQSAVGAAMSAPQPTAGEAPAEGTKPSVLDLGRRAAAVLQEGGVVPDALVALLVAAAIREVDMVSYAGFVLDSYPASAAQAKLLEKELTGYAPDEAEAAKPKGSKVAPPPADAAPPAARPPPALDLVIRVDVTDETSRRRALGRRLDPASGVVYHLETDPPPEEPGLQERLVSLTGASNAEAQLEPALKAYAESEAPLAGWLSSLDVLLALSADAPFEGVALEAEGAVRELLERKKAIAVQEAAAAAAKAAQEEAAAAAAAEVAAAAAAAAAEAAEEAGEDGAAQAAAEGAEGTEEAEAEPAFPPVLSAETAAAVLEQWRAVEDDFVAASTGALGKLRELRYRTLTRSAASRSEFVLLLRAPDLRQDAVATAQRRFNAMPRALRDRDDGKAELHMLVSEMQGALWGLSDERRAAAEAMLGALSADGWLAHHALRLVLAVLELAQAETNRYVRTAAVLKLYASLRAGATIGLALPELAQPAVPEAVALSVPPIDFSGRGGDAPAAPAINAKDAKGPPKGAPPAARAGKEAPAALTEALSALMAAYAKPVAPVPPPPPAAAAAATGKKGAPPPAEEEPAEPSREEALRAEWASQLVAAVESERYKLRRRLGSLARYGCGVLSELKRQAETVQAELDAMLGAKMAKETAAVSALAALMRRTAEAGDALDRSLALEDEGVLVDESLLMVPPPPPPPPPPLAQPAQEDRFSVAQLSTLGARLKAAAAGDLLPAAALSALLEQLSAGSFDAAEPPLPSAWRPLGAPAYAKLSELYAAGEPPLVAWPAVVATLAAVGRPSTLDLAAALARGAEAAGRMELLGREAAATEAPAGEEAPPAEGAAEGAAEEAPAEAPAEAPLLLTRAQFASVALWFEDGSPAEGAYPVATKLKEALFELFAEGGRLDLSRLLLYFCDEPAKAFVVAGFLRPPAAASDPTGSRAMLSMGGLHALLHRDAPPPAAGLAPPEHADPFSRSALARLWQELALDEAALVPHALLGRHPLGRAMLDACKAYTPKKPYALVASLHAKAQHALKM